MRISSLQSDSEWFPLRMPQKHGGTQAHWCHRGMGECPNPPQGLWLEDRVWSLEIPVCFTWLRNAAVALTKSLRPFPCCADSGVHLTQLCSAGLFPCLLEVQDGTSRVRGLEAVGSVLHGGLP